MSEPRLEDIEFETCLDAFSGTSSIAYVMKDMGKTVYTNDILRCNRTVAKSLIQNNSERITNEDIENILKVDSNYQYDYFIYNTFKDIYFLDDENKWLDIVVQNINLIENEHKKAMFFWAIYQSAISKRPYNLFHRKNLYVRTSDVKRNFGNKATWDKPFQQHFKKFVNEINLAIFDNKKQNRAFCNDVLDLEIDVDLVYIDTPYIPLKGTITHYRDFYHFLDGLSDYDNWKNEIDYSSKHKKLKSTYNIWEDKKYI